ncbi:TPA: hypothetical protein PWK54_005161 [Escherichia coli]|uniref:hypothetical protein n=1 Tax=Escherichia coli TaxID=562 RepID=UPI0015C993B5|nr:hypothetical protein [Escherichia coli]EGH1125542.1 hypothetical protein [Escherichia coli]EKO5000475.1 hypothetical protein [Escherichia coli]HCS5608875.1 hypothetical protein [Escherichia coli]HCW2811865.1 hypothetical protein [Escherichia coli]HDL0260893.1 hypothetical protein [Escherichia coli]
MKKSLISTFIAAACLTASGVAMAGDKEAVKNITVTTNVTEVSSVTIDLTNNPETVTTDDVKVPGTLLTTLDISSSGFDLKSVQGASIAVEVDALNTDTSGSWLFKNNDQPHSTQLKTRPKVGTDWSLGPQNKVTYRLKSSDGNSVNLQLPIETNSGNTNVPAGSYNLPMTVSYNTW